MYLVTAGQTSKKDAAALHLHLWWSQFGDRQEGVGLGKTGG